MRRLLILLLAMLAFGAPALPAQAAHRHEARMTMPASGSCHDDGQCATHACIGCAVQPAEPAAPARLAPIALPALVAAAPAFLSGRRPGFDPPPPRAIG